MLLTLPARLSTSFFPSNKFHPTCTFPDIFHIFPMTLVQHVST